MVRITIDSNIVEFKAWADEVNRYLSSDRLGLDMRSFLRERYKAMTRDQFNKRGAGQSGRWKTLSPAYAKIKARRYPGKPILEATGKMRRSLEIVPTGKAKRNGRGIEYSFGTNDNKAAYHQKGNKKMARRPIFDFSRRQKQELGRDIGKVIAERMSDFSFFDRNTKSTVKFTGWYEETMPKGE